MLYTHEMLLLDTPDGSFPKSVGFIHTNEPDAFGKGRAFQEVEVIGQAFCLTQPKKANRFLHQQWSQLVTS